MHQRESAVAVGERLGAEHELVGAGADPFDGGETLDAAVGDAVDTP